MLEVNRQPLGILQPLIEKDLAKLCFYYFGIFLGCRLLHWYGPCVYPLSKPLLSVLQTSDCCRLKAQVDLFFILKSSLLTQHLSLPKARTKFIDSLECTAQLLNRNSVVL